MYTIISKKKRGEALTKDEIKRLVREYTDGNIPDYQMSAFLMAVCFNGMSENETASLTLEMANSGDTVDLSVLGTLSADKHSTGGVGDKTTLVVMPLAACLGCKIAKMSGRGLGHTGGTVDKLESIEGYKTSLDPDEFINQAQEVGIAVVGQSANLAPADKKIYALRDVTATVDSIPLIASSIMSKKLAAGSKNIVLDVKYGSGAFMKTAEDAQRLAQCMVQIGKANGRNTRALITNMDVPLGKNIGNSLEVIESIEILKNKGDSELRCLCVELAANMASMALGKDAGEMKILAEKMLSDGTAFKKFREWIRAQGGNAEWIDNPDLFPRAKYEKVITAQKDGYITHIDTEKTGVACVKLGGGRQKKEDLIDFSAGIIMNKKTGDFVRKGEKIAMLYTNTESLLSEAAECFESAIALDKVAPGKMALIHKIIF